MLPFKKDQVLLAICSYLAMLHYLAARGRTALMSPVGILRHPPMPRHPSCCAECSKPHDPTDLAITDKIVRRTYFSRRNRLEHMGSSRNIGRGSRGGAAGTRDSCSARGERLSFSGATHRCLPRQFRRQRRARIRFRASSSSASHIYLVRNTTVSPRTDTYSPERASSPAPATEISCAGPDRFLRLHAASSTALPPLRESPPRRGCDARSPRFPAACAR